MEILNNLPDSLLKKILLEKMEIEGERYYALCTQLSCFRDYVVPELKQINVLYSEYTPHDEENHILNLFKVADIIIGNEVYQKMNPVELGLLIGGIYAHDWGMAVSEAERYYIATQRLQGDSNELILLDDEFERFEQFLKKKGGKISIESDKEIDQEIWREYIRNTHALRSGKRVKEYFKEFSGSVANALGKICVGHWLEIEDISDRNGYYRDSAILGETVNLKALTIYLRLVDLFDLAEDRTPYVLWKYVNPQNCYSKMEWEKHRALHQITCPKYENGRIICISGSTDNHEVYATLMDFKKLCERYFRENIEALMHMNDSRHKLDVYLMDWRIETEQFKPIEIGFTFDQENVFKILSDEIYNCHPYVFVRELIQNSIDAINLRKEVLERKGIGGGNLGLILFEVKTISDDEIQVSCIDDGIGMDEYILKNYFSVLGKSYYTSMDYSNLGINMNPISRFGVGILSCFSVANTMEICTRREPYIEEGKQGLRVLINDLKKTFRVEEIPDYRCDVGTRLNLTIKIKSLEKQLKKNNLVEDYSIINYIKKINKYIEYPIVVHEFDKKIIFVPKGYDLDKIKYKVKNYKDYEVYIVDIEYSSCNNVLPQDMEFFDEHFQIREIDIKKDLEIEEFEGTILFPVLKNEKETISRIGGDVATNAILIDEKTRIRWFDNHFSNESVYICNRGILLEENGQMVYHSEFRSSMFPNMLLCINFPKTISNISLSRFSYSDSWNVIGKVREKLHLYISNELIQKKGELCKYEFWRIVAIYMLQYRLNVEKMSPSVFKDIEYPFVNKSGELEYKCIEDKDSIRIIPNEFNKSIDKYGENGSFKNELNWDYGECLLSINERYNSSYSVGGMINALIYKSLSFMFYLDEITFVKDKGHRYLPQEIWIKGNEVDCFIKKIALILEDFGVNYEADKKRIANVYNRLLGYEKCVGFAEEFSQYFAYGYRLLNINHLFTQLFVKYIWCLEQLANDRGIDKILVGRKRDSLKEIPFFNTGYIFEKTPISFSETNKMLQELHEWLSGFYPQLGDDRIILTKDAFVEETLKFVEGDIYKEANFIGNELV